MPTPLLEPAAGPLPPETSTNGCFETMRAYGGRIFRLEGHLDRLYASAACLSTPMPADRRALAAQLRSALSRSGLKEAVVRVACIPQGDGLGSPAGRRPGRHTADRAEARSQQSSPGLSQGLPMGIPPRGAPPLGARPHIVVLPAQLPSSAMYRRGLNVAVVPSRKFSVASIDAQAKYSARLGSVMAVMDAQLRGVDEALFLDATGSVTESTASNFGIVKRGRVLTPPCWLGLLAGITRDVLFELAGGVGAPIEEMPLTRHELYTADEAFLTSTLKEVIAVTCIDGRRIGDGRPGPVTAKLLRAFRRLVRRELRLR